MTCRFETCTAPATAFGLCLDHALDLIYPFATPATDRPAYIDRLVAAAAPVPATAAA